MASDRALVMPFPAGTPASASARPRLGHWTDFRSSKAAEKVKEIELLGDFIRDVFGDMLGYLGPASGAPVYTLKRESLVRLDGKFADATLGRRREELGRQVREPVIVRVHGGVPRWKSLQA